LATTVSSQPGASFGSRVVMCWRLAVDVKAPARRYGAIFEDAIGFMVRFGRLRRTCHGHNRCEFLVLVSLSPLTSRYRFHWYKESWNTTRHFRSHAGRDMRIREALRRRRGRVNSDMTASETRRQGPCTRGRAQVLSTRIPTYLRMRW
jgi:hypothetical protein